MERYKNFVRMEQLKEALHEGNKDEALELADQIDHTRIKRRQDLNALAEVFLANGMLVKAKECLAEVYARGSSKGVLTKLINLCLKLKEAEEAEVYYQEFKRLAPKDYYNYIFRYSIDKLQSRPYPQLIETLEKLKKTEYIDIWAYELAKLYHKTGDEQKCIEECDEIAIWFGEGEYVDKARALKAYYCGELSIDELKDEKSAPKKTEDSADDIAADDISSDEELTIEELMANASNDYAEIFGDDAYMNMQERPADNKPVEVTPVEEVPEEEVPAEEMPAEEILAENIPAEKKTAEKIPEEETPAENIPAEETPSEKMPAEDKPIDLKPKQEQLIQEQPKKEKPKSSLAAMLEEEEARRGILPSDDSRSISNVREEKPAEQPAESTEPTAPSAERNASTTPVDEDERLIMEMLAGEENILAQMVNDELNKEQESEPESSAENVNESGESAEGEEPAAEEAKPVLIDMTDYEFRAIDDIQIPEDGFTAALLAKREETLDSYFGFFSYQVDMRMQLIKALELLLNPQIRNICLAVTGQRHSGKKSVIKGIARMLNHAGLLTDTKTAVTDAFKVNSMKLSEKQKLLEGKCFVIDRAGQLTAEASAELLKFNENNDGKTAVIICDTRPEINKLFRNNRDLNSMFPVRIHIPDFDKDDLIDMAAYEFSKGGYSIEEEAWELVKKEAVKLTKLKKEGSLKATEELARGAIDRLETRMAEAYLQTKRMDEGAQIVRESVLTLEDIEAVIRK